METVTLEREDFDIRLGNLYEPHADVEIYTENMNGITTHWFLPRKRKDNAVAVYLHGGGYIMGSIESHRNMLTHFAANLEMRVLFVEYRLAPEFPYPSGVNDAVTVYEYLLQQTHIEDIFLIGDSAGGGLAVAAVRTIQEKGLQLPKAVVLLSPWIYLEADAPSYKMNRDSDPIISQERVKRYAEMYRGKQSIEEVTHDDFSLTAFPPVLILVGAGEVLLDDCRNFHASISSMQPNSILSIHNNALHVWPLADIHSFNAKYALSEMKALLS